MRPVLTFTAGLFITTLMAGLVAVACWHSFELVPIPGRVAITAGVVLAMLFCMALIAFPPQR